MIEFLSLYLYQQIEDTGEFCENGHLKTIRC